MIVKQAETGMLAEQRGIFFDIDERRESDKAMLKTVEHSYSVMPRLLFLNPAGEESTMAMLTMLCQVSEDKIVRTNWMVRQAILVCYRGLLE